jgi:hypothetical protein
MPRLWVPLAQHHQAPDEAQRHGGENGQLDHCVLKLHAAGFDDLRHLRR